MVDRGAVRNTQDVGIPLRRTDFEAAKAAIVGAGFVYRHAAKLDLFLDGSDASPREAVHVVFANEFVRDGELAANPDVSESQDMGSFQVIGLEALVKIKLTAYRRKDQVHVLDMLGVGMIDASWVKRLPPALGARLQELIDWPDA